MGDEYAENVALFARPHGRYGSQRGLTGSGGQKSRNSSPRSQPSDPVKAHQEHWRAAGRLDDGHEDDSEEDEEEDDLGNEEVDTTSQQSQSYQASALQSSASHGGAAADSRQKRSKQQTTDPLSSLEGASASGASMSFPIIGGEGGEEGDDPSAQLFDEVLGNVHERALVAAGFGRLQWTLFVILGMAIMGDGIELLVIAYILPGAERELCMDDKMKGWLGEPLLI